MFESRFEFSLDDNIAGTIYTTKKKNKKLNIVIYVLLGICLLFAIISLILDIILGDSIIFDILLILLSIGVIIYHFYSPKMWKKSAIKTYNEYIAENKYCVVSIDDDSCRVSFYKENEEVSKMVLDLNNITACFEDEERFVIVFDKSQFVVVRKDKLSGRIEMLRDKMEQYLNDEGIIYVTKREIKKMA